MQKSGKETEKTVKLCTLHGTELVCTTYIHMIT